MRLAPLTRGPCSTPEVLVFGGVSLAAAFALYGPHIASGGFILDDWAFAAEAELYGREHGIASLVEHLRGDPDVLIGAGGRPLAAAYFALTHTVFGLQTGLHIALAIVLAALVSTLFYAVLRVLRMERLHAALISLLVLVFPAADATRLWPAAAVSLAGLAFYFAGLLLALWGLRRSGRGAVVLHTSALACYGLSLLQYEVAAAAIGVSVLVYRLRAPWRASVYRWLADLGLLATVAVYIRLATAKTTAPVDQTFERLDEIQAQTRMLLGALGLQDGQRRLPVPVVAAVLVVALVVWRLLPPRDETRGELGRWMLTAFAGLIVIGVGYVPFVPANDPQYVPLMPGLGNRTNVAAAFGYVLLIYAVAVLVGLLFVRAVALVRRVPVATAAAFAALAAVAVGALWVGKVNDDRRAYGRAYALERETLDVLRDGPRPARGSTVFTFGQPGEVAPFVPAFSRQWDLSGAVRLLWKDETLRGIPGALISRFRPLIGTRWGVACTASGVQPLGSGWSSAERSVYGRTVFVDVPGRRHVIIRKRADCDRALKWVEPTLEEPYRLEPEATSTTPS